MLKNYFKTAFRNLKRQKGYTIINLFGLALGLACCILIALYVRDELSHEDFHANADRIIVVGGKFGDNQPSLSTPYPLAGALRDNASGVEHAIRTLWPGSGDVSIDGHDFQEEEGVFHAEEGFFEIFSFPMIEGSAEGVLREPNTAVISEKLAQKYFPNENPIGKTFYAKERGEHAYQIVGVAQSNDNSYLDFNAVLSFSTLDYAQTHGDSWGSMMFQTFVLLNEGVTTEAFQKQKDAIVKARMGERMSQFISFVTQPLTGLYLSELVSSDGFSGQWRYIYIFGAVAIFILLIAFVNYVNLSTARAAQRTKEVGVRKTMGASRLQLMGQFMGEAVLMTAIAYVLALAAAQLALPVFNQLFGVELSFANAGAGWFLFLGMVTLGAGFFAGSYPALYLSAFKPAHVLKGKGQSGSSGSWLRKSLIVVQFMVAITLIIGTAVVYQQLNYVQQKDLGFEGDQAVTIPIPQKSAEALVREIRSQPVVASASITNGVPGRFRLTISRKAGQLSSEAKVDTSKDISMYPAVVDYQYMETLGVTVAAGRWFSPERTSDKERGYILNEQAAKALGWTPEEAIGKPISLTGGGEVIGVVEDFHFTSLRKQIEPVVLSLQEFESVSSYNMLAARLAPGSIQSGLRQIENVLSRFTDEPFTYSFLNDDFAEMYRTERRLAQVFGGFAGIAILLACLGLFGLAAFAARRRTKEIGIRKVLGATVANIVGLLSKDFLKLVALGFVIAVPIAWYAMNQWLSDFAYRIDVGPGIFLLAGGLALLIALATVSWQSIKAALANPVDSLRSE